MQIRFKKEKGKWWKEGERGKNEKDKTALIPAALKSLPQSESSALKLANAGCAGVVAFTKGVAFCEIGGKTAESVISVCVWETGVLEKNA